MLSAILFVIAVVALGQFGLYYWRAVFTTVATQPLSNRVLEAIHIGQPALSGADFPKLSSVLEMTPELEGGGAGLGVVRAYYALIGAAARLLGRISPALLDWTTEEQVLCARYAAVLVARRLEANRAEAASIRSC